MSWIYKFGYHLSRELARGLFDYQAEGLEHRIDDGPALIACNHASYFDPPLVGIAYDNPVHFVARSSLFAPGLAEAILRRCNTIPINRERPDLATIRRILAVLRGGHRVVIFPEGTRTRDGRLGQAGAGIGMIVAKAGVPVQPVRLFGSFDALPRGAKFPRPAQVRLVIGEPLAPDDLLRAATIDGKPDPRRIAQLVMQAIASLQPGQ